MSEHDIVFGRVPHPPFVDRVIPDSHNVAWNSLGDRRPKGVVYHRQVGTNWGTDGWFRMLDYFDRATGMWRPGGGRLGLTDYGIDHTTGEILKWNEPDGRDRATTPGGGAASAHRSGWASGPWEGPPGDGIAFVAKYGSQAINRDLISLEVAGQYDSPIAERAFERIAQLSAYWADQCAIPWTDYPLNPHTGLTFTYWHSEFQHHKPCPGAAVFEATGPLIERTRAILEAAQEQPAPPPTYAHPGPVPTDVSAHVTLNGKPFWRVTCAFKVQPPGAPRRQYASIDSLPTGPDLAQGETFESAWIVTEEAFEGRNEWVISAYGSRIPMARLTPKLDLTL